MRARFGAPIDLPPSSLSFAHDVRRVSVVVHLGAHALQVSSLTQVPRCRRRHRLRASCAARSCVAFIPTSRRRRLPSRTAPTGCSYSTPNGTQGQLAMVHSDIRRYASVCVQRTARSCATRYVSVCPAARRSVRPRAVRSSAVLRHSCTACARHSPRLLAAPFWFVPELGAQLGVHKCRVRARRVVRPRACAGDAGPGVRIHERDR